MASGNSSSSETFGGGCGSVGPRKEILLFGVRVVVDPMRKCVSLNNLSEYEQPEEMPKKIGGGSCEGEEKNKADVAAGYASADDAVPISSSAGGSRERKRGTPWTEEEHKLFLLGLQKVGKGDWKGISRNFVKTRTPTQVASHAQKYFLRRSNLNRRRRRSSLFDMTTETVTMPMEEDQVLGQENASPLCPFPLGPDNNSNGGSPVIQMFPTIPMPMPTETPSVDNTHGQSSHSNYPQKNSVHVVSLPFQVPPAFNLNTDLSPGVNSPLLSLNLSLASPSLKELSTSPLAFKMMPSFSSGDSNSITGVA